MLKQNAGLASKLATNFLPVCVLTAIVFACFGRTLGSYFVADDFGQVAYAGDIVKGNVNALLSNFTGNYLQCPVMKIYRPCLLLSLIFDYMIWGTNAFGYFLTDILFLAASAVMLYFLLRELTRSWAPTRSMLFSLLSAALFASSPLHCESISFVSGRDNVISSFFYLLSLWFFVKRGIGKSEALLTLGSISYWIALLSKEMAIGLPVVLTGLALILPESFSSDELNSKSSYTLKERLSLTFRVSLPIWLNTVVYFLVRFLALGTFTGGYTGGIGSELLSTMVRRWTDLDTIFRIMFPFNLEVFGIASGYRAALAAVYTVLATLAVIRILSGKYQVRWIGFLVFWVFTTVAPLYQLWSLGLNLQGARFFFFLTMSLAAFAPLFILAPAGTSIYSPDRRQAGAQLIDALGVLALAALVGLSIIITNRNNIPWVHAGKQSKACMQDGQRLAGLTAPGKKLVLLGIPKEEAGAHIIYNGPTFNTMMSPPFSETNCFEKFLTFDPMFYGNWELVNTQRLKKVLLNPDVVGIFVWNHERLRFERLPLPSRTVFHGAGSSMPLIFKENVDPAAYLTSDRGVTNVKGQQMLIESNGLWLAPASVNPYEYDFLEFVGKPSAERRAVSVFWKGSGRSGSQWQDSKYPVHRDNLDSGSVTRLRLSDHWRWFTEGDITQLQLAFSPGAPVKLTQMQLISAGSLVPTISIANKQENNLGHYPTGKEGVQVDFDARSIKYCTAVRIDISKPNFFFEGLSQEESKEATQTSLIQTATNGQVHIPANTFPSPGYYELRAACLDAGGRLVGELSDPLVLNYN